jgi:hypothetical protein
MPCPIVSLVMSVELEAKQRIYAAAIVTYYVLQKYDFCNLMF